MLNSDAPVRIPTTFAPVSVRMRKIENGTSGLAERSSIATKAAISAADAASSPIVWPEPQPASGASISAVDEQREAGGDGDRAGDVERARLGLGAALGDQRGRERGRDRGRSAR